MGIEQAQETEIIMTRLGIGLSGLGNMQESGKAAGEGGKEVSAHYRSCFASL